MRTGRGVDDPAVPTLHLTKSTLIFPCVVLDFVNTKDAIIDLQLSSTRIWQWASKLTIRTLESSRNPSKKNNSAKP
jgi:hypothetical protein